MNAPQQTAGILAIQFAAFPTVNAAKAWQAHQGGWIFAADDGEVIWYRPPFTPSKIFTHYTTAGKNGRLI